MAKKSKNIKQPKEIVYAPAQNQLITDTIEKNYMPYVMSVIVSRAIPEIDGLKPSHRKLLYTMYEMGLLKGSSENALAYIKAETRKCVILCYDEECEALAGKVLFPIGKKDDLATQARRLFAALREADTTDAEIIYAHLPPQEGLGLALYNRLIRAAAHTVKEV